MELPADLIHLARRRRRQHRRSRRGGGSCGGGGSGLPRGRGGGGAGERAPPDTVVDYELQRQSNGLPQSLRERRQWKHARGSAL